MAGANAPVSETAPMVPAQESMSSRVRKHQLHSAHLDHDPGIIKKVLMETIFAPVLVPRSMKIDNQRVSFLNRTLQISISLAVCYYILLFPSRKESLSNDDAYVHLQNLMVPRYGNNATLYQQGLSDAFDSAAYCTTPATYEYRGSLGTDRSYDPVGCIDLSAVERFQIDSTSVTFLTFVKENIVTQTLNTFPCGNLRPLCEARGGTFDGEGPVLEDERRYCRCIESQDFFVPAPEVAELELVSEFSVTFNRMKLPEGGFTRFFNTRRPEHQVLVRIMKAEANGEVKNGVTPVYTEFLPGTPVSLTLPQWLEAAGITLEDENTNAEENLILGVTSKYPKRRLTGVNIVLDVACHEAPYHHLKVPDTPEWTEIPSHHGSPVVCMVTPRAASSVAEKVEVVYDTVRDKDEVIASDGTYVYRERYTFGVHFTMGTSYGQFREFSWTAAIIGFSAMITTVLLARTITRVVATFFLGDMSRVYYRAYAEPIRMVEKINAYVVRMVDAVGTYDEIFKKEVEGGHCTVGDFKKEVEDRLTRVLRHQEALDQKEIHNMTRSVVNQIGGVDEESWVRAACASEFIGVPDVVHHFDHDRKKTCLERLFEDARIKKAREEMRMDDDGIHEAVHVARTDVPADEDWPIDEFGWHTVVAKLVEIGIDDAEDAFMYIDADGGGTISYEELLEAVEKLGLNGTKEDCQRMMKQADKDGNGVVDLDEFLAWQSKVEAENDSKDARTARLGQHQIGEDDGYHGPIL